MRLVSVQVGWTATYPVPGAEDPDEVFTSAIGKRAVTGPVRLGQLGLAGDEVADTRVIGTVVLEVTKPRSPCIKLADWRLRLAREGFRLSRSER